MTDPLMAATWFSEGEAPLVGREGVRQDGRRVGEEEGPADALDEPEDDELPLPCHACPPREEEQQGTDGEDGEADVVKRHPPEHVGDPAEGDKEDGRGDVEPGEHPQEKA